jgi:protein SCO1
VWWVLEPRALPWAKGTVGAFSAEGDSMFHRTEFCNRVAAIFLSGVLLCMATGCGSAPAPVSTSPAAPPAEQHFTLRGQVIKKNMNDKELLVNHEEIPGFMAAMTMPYPVKDQKDLDAAQPGDMITARVVVQGQTAYWLDQIKVTDSSGRSSVPEEATIREVHAGDRIPDVPFTNQDGKTMHLRDLKGQAVLLTFIYTRCPLPDFCPLISSQFAAIHKQLAALPAIYKKAHLVSVTLDPTYDTPPVLRKYGLAYLSDDANGFKQWEFVNTPQANLQKLAAACGLEYYEQDKQISHSMSTILLGPDGAVVKSWPGNDWRSPEVMAAIQQSVSK